MAVCYIAEIHQTCDAQVLITSMYYDNWITVFPFIPQKDGSAGFYINAGTKRHAAHDVADIGTSAAGDTYRSQIDQAACICSLCIVHMLMCTWAMHPVMFSSARCIRNADRTASARSCPGGAREI